MSEALTVSNKLSPNEITHQLSEFQSEIEEARAKILSALEVHHPHFIKTSVEMSSIEGEVKSLETRLTTLETYLNNACQTATSEDKINLENAYSQKNQIANFKEAEEFLLRLCELQKTFTQFDKNMESHALDIASEHCKKASELIQALSTANQNFKEPKIMREIKLDFYQRKGRLVAKLDEVLSQMFVFSPQEIIIHTSISAHPIGSSSSPEDAIFSSQLSFLDILYSLESLELLDAKLRKLSNWLIENILQHLIDRCNQQGLNFSKWVHESELNSENGSKCWRWYENIESNKSENQSSFYKLIPTLQSLMEFIYEVFSGAQEKSFLYFGNYIWSWLSKQLLEKLPAPSLHDGQLLKKFESYLTSIRFINESSIQLNSLLDQTHKSLHNKERIIILENSRKLLVSQDSSTVSIKKSKLAENVDAHQLIPESSPWLSTFLSDTSDFFSFPDCQVTEVTYNLVKIIESLLEKADNNSIDPPNSGNDKNTTSWQPPSQSYLLLVREIASLFIIIRPTSIKPLLLTDARSAALFFTDCTYLAHHLMTIPFVYKSAFRHSAFAQFGFYVDLILALRKLQESTFTNMMQGIKQKIFSSLSETVLFKNLSRNSVYSQNSKSIEESLKTINFISEAWSSILPKRIYLESLAILINSLLKHCQLQIMSLTHHSAQDIHCLNSLLKTFFSQLDTLFNKSLNNIEDIVHFKKMISHFEPLNLIHRLLQSNLASLIEIKEDFNNAFNKEELKQLLGLSYQLNCSVETAMSHLTYN